MNLNNWHNFWQLQLSPLTRESDTVLREKFAQEISFIIGSDLKDKNLLELGCGNGLLFEDLGFMKTTYTGVDFSERFLEIFREKYPHLNLILSLAEDFSSENTYDLIFSNGMIQYLTSKKLTKLLSNIVTMMNPGGKIVLCSIPWKIARKGYIKGEFTSIRPKLWSKFILSYIKQFFFDSMGHWYTFNNIREIAEPLGLKVMFYGSLNYPYRFHVCLEK